MRKLDSPAPLNATLRPPAPDPVTSLGPGVHLKGEIMAMESVHVAGRIEGAVLAQDHDVLVDEGGLVGAGITARDVIVRGSVSGGVRASGRLEIARTGRLTGPVVVSHLAIEDGAFLDGSVRIEGSAEKPEGRPMPATASTVPTAPTAPASSSEPTRQSIALRHLLDHLSSVSHALVLDLGGASQGNIDHLTIRGHCLHTEDLLGVLDGIAGPQTQVGRFLAESPAEPPRLFDAVLCWDVLAYLPLHTLPLVLARIRDVLTPGGIAMAYFHSSPAAAQSPPGRFEILGPGLIRRRTFSPGAFGAASFLTPRDVERFLGAHFKVTSFVTPDGFHEVLFTRPLV
jgi:cytoskeletal protein CcmA (bactofilin family)